MYQHTQKAPMFLVLLCAAAGMAIMGMRSTETWMTALGWGMCAVFFALAASFTWLTIRDEGTELVIRFGPIPLFTRRVRYREIREVMRARSKIIDGWGIHYVIGRGWTWNLWGFDCVELQFEHGRRLRLGTDDADNLAAFLRKKTEK